ncbi:HepT-like ribonuclease domain-containing protein [Larkinella soli]|uniref:HepT-like ribonuclease domain-containing protein n=1 Tax=Larkinella soli TaxID=1770527 RepID=UPI000FFBD143|nr:HepT-like ribonuclease domain-containing protein [Larkinella soli]
MKDEVSKFLLDILQAIQHIDVHLGGKYNFYHFSENITIRRAKEREFEIIGEATNRILKLDDSILISNARQIVDLRNRVIHAYDSVDEAVVWSIICNRLPVLKSEVEALLNQSETN